MRPKNLVWRDGVLRNRGIGEKNRDFGTSDEWTFVLPETE